MTFASSQFRGWFWAMVFGTVFLQPGCSRRFYRNQADKDVDSVIAGKDHHPAWKIEELNYYPDPRSRFASPGNQDRPPMPPDDPAAMEDAPRPQKPRKAGLAYIEGAGYLNMLSDWDTLNREDLKSKKKPDTSLASDDESGTSRRGAGYGSDSWETDTQLAEALGQRPGAIDVRGEKESPEAQPAFRITLDQSSELALINSREFQTQRENVYLAALPVTSERFGFTAQFFAREQALREWSGSDLPEGLRNRWRPDSEIGVTQRFATGALLVARLANQTVVEMGNGNPRVISPSVLSFDFFQPLFQGGGKAVTLEPLTLAERGLVYQIRWYARFRKQFYTYLAAGGSMPTLGLTSQPAVRIPIGALPGAGAAGVGEVQVPIGTNGPLPVGAEVFQAPNNGYLATLLNAAILANQRENVESLAGFFDQYRQFQIVGEVPELQVSQVRQSLITAQTQVIQNELNLRDALDRFKLQLGVPPTTPLELDDGYLESQRDQLQRFQELTSQAAMARRKARALGSPDKLEGLRPGLRKILADSKIIRSTQKGKVTLDLLQKLESLTNEELLERIQKAFKARRDLTEKKDFLGKKGEPFLPEDEEKLREAELDVYVSRFEQSLRKYKVLITGKTEYGPNDLNQYESLLEDYVLLFVQPRNELLSKLKDLWPVLPPICVEGVDLLMAPLDIALDSGVRYSLLNRLDLMNGRAQLVDAWRQIAVAANGLLGAVDVRYNMQALSPDDVARPLAFSGSRVRHRMAINAEAPLVRIVERNAYRATLFNWQRERRNLMAFEDTIVLEVRSQIRALRALARNYELQKQIVELAYLNLDNALEVLYAPSPGSQGPQNEAQQAALTLQLLQQQNAKVNAQNSLYTFWINYIRTRIQLYRDLELMPLDPRGVWIDDIQTCQCQPGKPGSLEPVPQPADQLPPPRPGTGSNEAERNAGPANP
jgi:hypothetical protein